LKKRNLERRRMTKEILTPEKMKELQLSSGSRFGTDGIPIRLQGMSFCYEGFVEKILDHVDLSVPQGKLVAVVGSRRQGKSTFLKILGQVLFPTEGVYFVPSYLRILYIGEEPLFLKRSLWSNLAIGQFYWTDRVAECDRVLRICRRIGVGKVILSVLEKNKDDFVNGIDDVDIGWQLALSNSERVLISLARALIYNPEVLVMNRPTQRLPDSASKQVIKLITEYVRNRGVDLPADTTHRRRPRTAFVSFVRCEGVRQADVIWKVEKSHVTPMDQADVDLDRELME
jgi:ABC-type multidrug transport system fused ATPase/permease subunit